MLLFYKQALRSTGVSGVGGQGKGGRRGAGQKRISVNAYLSLKSQRDLPLHLPLPALPPCCPSRAVILTRKELCVENVRKKPGGTMAQRHLFIEQPSGRGQKRPTHIQVSVDEFAAIGPWVTTLAARLGYPLVDNFGSPLAYRLYSLSGEIVLPTTGRFADARFPSGSHFVLEPETYKRGSMNDAPTGRREMPIPLSPSTHRISRRSLMRTGILTTFSVVGFGSGMTTAFAQRLLDQRQASTAPISILPSFATIGKP